MKEYMAMFYNLQPEERIFPFTKSYLDHDFGEEQKKPIKKD